jgi:hypothetical protein
MYFSLFPYNFPPRARYYIRTVELFEAGTAVAFKLRHEHTKHGTVQTSEAEALLTTFNMSPNILKSNSVVCSPC